MGLICSYVEEGIPSHARSQWSLQALDTAISKGTHASAFTL